LLPNSASWSAGCSNTDPRAEDGRWWARAAHDGVTSKGRCTSIAASASRNPSIAG
jgi:hypothetical protein